MAIPAITAILSAANEAGKAVASILHVVKDTETKQKVIELQTAILGLHDRIRLAQSEHDDLAKAKDELERKLTDYQRWDTEAARYELRELAPGIFAYALKPEHKSTEPEHYLCPHCFGEKKRSILQHPRAGYTNYACHACKFEINPVKQSIAFATVKRRDPYNRPIF